MSDSAAGIAGRVSRGELSALEVAKAALGRVRAIDPRVNAFTSITEARALAEAASIDARRRSGAALGPLAGVPYAVKNLYDIAGVTTLAGSKINAELRPAARDAFVVSRLREAGAVLLGALNMDEYAYGFTTENAHYGPTRNPHDTGRIAGGSSGGSAAVIAAGMVPISLGSDTGGSIRVPASLCGVFGLKPTFGRLSRRGAFPFVASLDHCGPLAGSARDLAAVYDALQGADPEDPACTRRAPEPVLPQLDRGTGDLRIAMAGDYFERYSDPDARGALDIVARALGASRKVVLPETERARACMFLITASEASNVHFANLGKRPQDFDPMTRDRFLAAALLPSTWVVQAQRFKRWYLEQVLRVFADVDVILAPATPCTAPRIGQDMVNLNGQEFPMRAGVGMLAQPFSFIGVPVVVAPVARPGRLPIGVQIIAAPWREADAFRIAALLEKEGIAAAPVAP